MDLKTASDVARPRHKLMGDQDVHGWITAASLREIFGLEGQATVVNVESTFSFARCIRQRSVEAPGLWLSMAMQILENVEPKWMKKKMGKLMENRDGRDHQIGQLYVGRQLLDHVSLNVALGADDEGSD